MQIVTMQVVHGGVTAAKGFKAAGVEANIKYQDRKDMALVFSEVPAVSAGVFTTNVVKAAPVKWDMEMIRSNEKAQAIVLNSGIANACTGAAGEEANEYMAVQTAEALGIDTKLVLTASTGVIGVQLPKEKIRQGAVQLKEALSDTEEAGLQAAKAVMTTDTFAKQFAVEIELDGRPVILGAMAKGSGMIHPNMATMLSVLTTDADISKELLQKALSEVVESTFNMISVDRDTSTNDTYVVLANGLAGNRRIELEDKDYQKFKKALEFVSRQLAMMLAKDGEGATKLIEAQVIRAASKQDAVTLAKSVISSNLVKTAVYGSDANWGRILCALGYSGVEFDPEKVHLFLADENGCKMQIVKDGQAVDFSEEEATRILSGEKVTAIVDMKAGTASATAWGCDLTHGYIKINGDYRS